MRKFYTYGLSVLVGCLSLPAMANLGFSSLSNAQFEEISKDLAANFSHRSVSGAASLGAVFGMEVNIFAASTSSSRLNDLSKSSGGGALPNLFNGGLMAGVSVPFGITFEGLLLPSLKQDGVKFSGNSLGIRWRMNDVIPVLPVNLALRLNQSQTQFGFSQNLSTVNGTVDSDIKVQEVGLYLSPKMPIIEPYAGLSYVSVKTSMDFVGTGSFFSVGNSNSASFGGTKTVLGLSVLIPFFSFGVEYVSLLGTSGYGLKLGMSF